MELKKHITDEQTGIGYTLCGDYYLPDLELPEEQFFEIGRFGRAKLRYLQKCRRVLLVNLSTGGKLNRYLHEVDIQCEEMFSRLVKAKNEGKALNTKEAQHKRVSKRLNEVNRLVDRLYEDNISGKISETNFVRMLGKYQQEQEALLAEKEKLEGDTAAVREIRSDAEHFADLLERYGDISELTPEILNMLVEKILVYEPRAVDGVMRQQIDVYYRYIGVIKLVDYGSTTYYKSHEVLTAAKKRENAKMEKRIAAVKEEVQESEAVSA